MKTFYKILFLVSLFAGQQNGNCTGVQGYSQSYCFKGADDSTYVETAVNVLASTVTYLQNNDKKFSAQIEITIAYLKDSVPVKFYKYILNSPLLKDTSDLNFNLIDMKRTNLLEGKYLVYVSVRDLNNKKSVELQNQETIEFSFPKNKISVSSIKFLSSYNKTIENNIYSFGGFDLKPTGINFIPTTQNQLAFYVELYQAKEILGDSNISIVYSIRDKKGNVVNSLAGISKQKAKTINPVLAAIDITDLPSGNYDFCVELKNAHNKIITQKFQFFQRQKNISIKSIDDLNALTGFDYFISMVHGDSISFYLEALSPVASPYELDFIQTLLKQRDTLLEKKYMFYFWQKRDLDHPIVSWLDYKNGVDLVEENYSAMNKHGWETDRGRVVLQYGLPNAASGIIYEAGAHPYDIWHYYNLSSTGQTNVRFVFYDPGTGTNDFKLIYSDAVSETKDDHWRQLIYNQWGTNSNLDQTDTQDYIGKKVDDYFNK